jgi:hypothetical protein
MSITQAVHCHAETNARRGWKTIMFPRSKLCLLIALSAWLAVDGYFSPCRSPGRGPAFESAAFWNERLCDAPLKLVQRGVIHHLRLCRQSPPVSWSQCCYVGEKRNLQSRHCHIRSFLSTKGHWVITSINCEDATWRIERLLSGGYSGAATPHLSHKNAKDTGTQAPHQCHCNTLCVFVSCGNGAYRP